MSGHSFFIPNGGWDTGSIVWGYIKFEGGHSLAAAEESIASYSCDEVYPFTNIFCGGSAARYGAAAIGFAGSYKPVEGDWSEWLWKFADVLSHLRATDARACLDCVIGSYRWTLEPKTAQQTASDPVREWIITRRPENGFSVLPNGSLISIAAGIASSGVRRAHRRERHARVTSRCKNPARLLAF